MSTKFVVWGCILAALAVLFGAFGTHLVEDELKILNEPEKIRFLNRGVQYQFYHSLALILTGVLYRQRNNRQVKNAGILFVIGIIMFSGSLYFMTLGILVHRSFDFVWPLTPIGGISFLIGWVLLALSFDKKVSASAKV